MIVVGALLSAIIFVAYFGLFGLLTGLWAKHCREQKTTSGWDRLITALLVGFLAAPGGCIALYVPISGYEGKVIKPRLVESTLSAYTISLLAIFLGVLVTSTLLYRYRSSG